MDKVGPVIIFGLIGFILLAMVLAIVWAIVDCCRWSNAKEFTKKCRLLKILHEDSTEESQAVPVFTGNGVGVGVATSGHSESYTTVWDCGEYGRLVSDDKEVFRWAKPESILYLKTLDSECRIEGIKGPSDKGDER